MFLKVKDYLKALILTAILGSVVIYSLYFFAQKFFRAKVNQTQIKDSEIQSTSGSEIILAVGQPVPKIEGLEAMTSNAQIDFSKILIINFWASWCEPCLEEFASMARLLKKLENKNIQLVAINEDESEQEALNFLKAFEADYKGLGVSFLKDKAKKTSSSFGVLALPESFIVKEGKLVKRVTGFIDWDTEGVLFFFKSLQKDEVQL